MSKDVNINVRARQYTKDRLEMICKRSGKSQSEVISDMIGYVAAIYDDIDKGILKEYENNGEELDFFTGLSTEKMNYIKIWIESK